MSTKPEKNLNIILGITGGIAAYKACDLIRLFTKAGHNVKVILTDNGSRFVTELTLETLSGNRVYKSLFGKDSFSTEHITLSKWADALLVAPASANIIGKFASGIADDLLSTMFLSFAGPVIVAPAMHTEMYTNSIVRQNMDRLQAAGVNIIPAESGDLASGDKGEGRFPDSSKIRDITLALLTKKKDLLNRNILITAGPTIEKIDPARFISSPSSGKMGVALAREAEKRGAKVTLVHGPLGISHGLTAAKVIEVKSASEMNSAVLGIRNCDVFIGTAAVSDYSPRAYSPQKIKKNSHGLNLELKRNPDVIANFAMKYGRKKIIVGFAAESNDVVKNARRKLKEKRLDMIVANDISRGDSGFGSDMNRIILIGRGNKTEKFPLMHKSQAARIIMDRISRIKK